MSQDDRTAEHGPRSRPPASGGHGGNGDRAQDTKTLTPVLVEGAGAEFGLVWVTASRSELVPGALFVARGRHFLVTGRSPSGATFVCRDVTDELEP